MTDFSSPYGYPLRRNGSCIAGEIECANPWGDWHSCCPDTTTCANYSSRGMCCPTDADCSRQINEDPHCSNNKTWDLYYSNGYFCCLSTSVGYNASNLYSGGKQVGGVACGDHVPSGSQYSILTPESRGTDYIDSGPSTPVIVGAVFAAVLGFALIATSVWFLLHRRQRRQEYQDGEYSSKLELVESTRRPDELDSSSVRAELGAGRYPAHELSAHTPRLVSRLA
ncbi:hypothetical protein BJY04DRAFT_213186 [Aspergillus karnatakaensis]|uniref:uncharacterized protein n=1 Tax=Aspergillus karnatakaensis TaxID=1810916 RepID=UPI003CCCA50E